MNKGWQITQGFKRRGSWYYPIPKEPTDETVSGTQGKWIVIYHGEKGSHCQNLSLQEEMDWCEVWSG